ncbi:hypothetical protein SDC9_113343 [bioreactor metagenome]|uniref:Uncharacterized protein n=1 Tax=bioreactor metagenome TaxID=1076179 RepID=A0A645BM54_9ZZZZ
MRGVGDGRHLFAHQRRVLDRVELRERAYAQSLALDKLQPVHPRDVFQVDDALHALQNILLEQQDHVSPASHQHASAGLGGRELRGLRETFGGDIVKIRQSHSCSSLL